MHCEEAGFLVCTAHLPARALVWKLQIHICNQLYPFSHNRFIPFPFKVIEKLGFFAVGCFFVEILFGLASFFFFFNTFFLNTARSDLCIFTLTGNLNC